MTKLDKEMIGLIIMVFLLMASVVAMAAIANNPKIIQYICNIWQ